jgi:GT2 family glycosyltransferase
MHVTVCICTRGRGASVVSTLRSIRTSTYDDFDVVVIDQSTNDDTAQAVSEEVADDFRFTFIRTTTVGSSVARNIATAHATGPLVAFTDDDCVVSANWLSVIVRAFSEHPDAGEVCGSVLPAPHDQRLGFIPTCEITRFRPITTRWHKRKAPGILANMAFRLDVLRAVGPFDEVLGAGGPLFSCADGDMTYRILRAGYVVLNVPEACVVHSGFRSWKEGRPFMRRVGMGLGATYFKYLRMGDLAVIPTLWYEWRRSVSWRRVLLLHGPTGIARFFTFVKGILVSFRYPIDRTTCTYIPIPQAAPSGEVTGGALPPVTDSHMLASVASTGTPLESEQCR